MPITGHTAAWKIAHRDVIEYITPPGNPRFKPIFSEDRQPVLYCQPARRSALATAELKDLGFYNTCHIEGRFSAWENAGGETSTKDAKWVQIVSGNPGQID
ncbi:rhodanese-like domain-containing protein [Porticoccus litoralis]|uniref:rhodanese-like domain-containing protein n=1 Tax=Porticoccus litoralis TaxID=434086 RepID=UPI0034E28B93